MYYIRSTSKSVDEAAKALEAAVVQHGFGVLHVYDLKATLASKGFDLAQECRILEVCKPDQAVRVLDADMNLNMALPCRISVYENDGRTRIGTIRPASLLGTLSSDPRLEKTAQDVEQAIVRMIDDAAGSDIDPDG